MKLTRMLKETTQRYRVGHTIQDGPYKGFVVTDVTTGWYKVYHPSNVNDGDPGLSFSKRTYRGRGERWDRASTKIRWGWAE